MSQTLSVEFKLDYYCFLRYAGKIDVNVKLLQATGPGAFICDAIQRMGHSAPACITVPYMHVLERENV